MLVSLSLGSARRSVHAGQCVSALRALEMPVFVRIHSSRNHVTGVGGPYGLWESRRRLSHKMRGLSGCNPPIN